MIFRLQYHHRTQVLQLQSALHAPATTGKPSKENPESEETASRKTGSGGGGTMGRSVTVRDPATNANAPEEELMLSENYGPESSHLNELMKKVRTAFCFC